MKPVNLNQFRKSKARAEQKARANRNAISFGRSKAEKASDASKVTSLRSHVDAHKRDDSDKP